MAEEKPRCPERRSLSHSAIDTCDLTRGKVCVLEVGGECDTYNDFLEEEEEEDDEEELVPV